MINFSIQVDPSAMAIADAILRLKREYGSAVGDDMPDSFILICEESNATFCQRCIDESVLAKLYRIRLVALPPEMLRQGAWCIARNGTQGVFSLGAA